MIIFQVQKFETAEAVSGQPHFFPLKIEKPLFINPVYGSGLSGSCSNNIQS